MKHLPYLFAIYVFISGCAATNVYPYKTWSSLETPTAFGEHELWVLVMLNTKGDITQRLEVKFSDVVAETCASDDWKKVEIVNEFPERSGMFQGEAAYYLKGAALVIDLSANLCDAGYELRGQLKEVGISGEHYPVSMFGGEVHGTFYGVPIKGN